MESKTTFEKEIATTKRAQAKECRQGEGEGRSDELVLA